MHRKATSWRKDGKGRWHQLYVKTMEDKPWTAEKETAKEVADTNVEKMREEVEEEHKPKQKVESKEKMLKVMAENRKLLSEQPRYYMAVKRNVSKVCSIM